VSTPSKSPKAGRPLTGEQARKAYRLCKVVAIAAIAVTWLYIALGSALLRHGVSAASIAVAVAYTLAAPWMLRYLKRDFERRAGLEQGSI
jgi:hypothetical protein